MTSPQPVSEVPTVEIPAAEYDEALAFCNERLKEQDKEPIVALPPGRPGDPRSCPCASACGAYVEIGWWSMGGGKVSSDGHPSRFVQSFDKACEGMFDPFSLAASRISVLPLRATQAPAGGKVSS